MSSDSGVRLCPTPADVMEAESDRHGSDGQNVPRDADGRGRKGHQE